MKQDREIQRGLGSAVEIPGLWIAATFLRYTNLSKEFNKQAEREHRLRARMALLMGRPEEYAHHRVMEVTVRQYLAVK